MLKPTLSLFLGWNHQRIIAASAQIVLGIWSCYHEHRQGTKITQDHQSWGLIPNQMHLFNKQLRSNPHFWEVLNYTRAALTRQQISQKLLLQHQTDICCVGRQYFYAINIEKHEPCREQFSHNQALSKRIPAFTCPQPCLSAHTVNMVCTTHTYT